MKLFTSTLSILAILAAVANGYDVVTQVSQESEASQVGQVQPEGQSEAASQAAQQDDGCTLSGNYTQGTDVSQCSHIVVDSLSVPAGVTLDLTNVTAGAHIQFQGTTTFGQMVSELDSS